MNLIDGKIIPPDIRIKTNLGVKLKLSMLNSLIFLYKHILDMLCNNFPEMSTSPIFH